MNFYYFITTGFIYFCGSIYPDFFASLEDGGDVAEILRAEWTSRKAWLHGDVRWGTKAQGRSVEVWNDGRQFVLDWV